MKRFIGNKQFYRMVLIIAIPIMIQNGITNFVGMLDNIMIGRVGTEQMAGVSIANELMFVFNLAIFGAISGPGIFGAQFFGNGDHEGVRHTFRFKVIIGSIISLVGILIFSTIGEQLISLYLHESKEVSNIEAALGYAKDYLRVMLFGLIPFVASQCYSSTLRETGETKVPMIAGIVAVLVNLLFNALLIFGLCGLPKLGAVGAAIATVISRFVETLIIIIWTHRHTEQNKFIVNAYQTLYIPGSLVKNMMIKGTPLFINEALWAGGMTMMTQCYSKRGLEVIAGLNIANTITNLFNIVFIALGSAVAIIVGQLLGANKMKEAKETAGKLIFFSVMSCVIVGFAMGLIAPLFPRIYKVTDNVKYLATNFIIIMALSMPFNACTHASYFTLRSGGKTIVTFLFDSVFVWVCCVPSAFVLIKFTTLTILPIYLLCRATEIIKCIIGLALVKKGVWLNNIVVNKS